MSNTKFDLHFLKMQSILALMQSTFSNGIIDVVTVDSEMSDCRYTRLWNSIIVEDSIKDRLFRSAALSLLLREQLPFEITSLHGLVLLYGPPGTGKTTLARGLPHQLASITKCKRTQFIEINPHVLMSAEHGQSQRNVTELLTESIPDLCQNNIPTVVLLDEVESIAVARSEVSLAANPADVHRATDAVLAALDSSTMNFTNLIFVATSNFIDVLDMAFRSRVDAAIHIPTPSKAGIVEILKHTLLEMSQAYKPLAQLAQDPQLEKVAEQLEGSDGRRVRKSITEAMLGSHDTVLDPGSITLEDLLSAATRTMHSANHYNE